MTFLNLMIDRKLNFIHNHFSDLIIQIYEFMIQININESFSRVKYRSNESEHLYLTRTMYRFFFKFVYYFLKRIHVFFQYSDEIRYHTYLEFKKVHKLLKI